MKCDASKPLATKPAALPADSLHHAEGATGEANGDMLAARAATMLPAELLHGGEIIILLLKPSPLFILLAPIRTLLAMALLTALVLLGNSYVDVLADRDVVLLGVGMIGLRVFWQFLEWLSRVYLLTDQRVIRVEGVITVRVFETPLKQIQHTNLVFTLRERLFGLGTIGFATAGTGITEAYWRMVARPLEVHRKVVEVLRRYRR